MATVPILNEADRALVAAAVARAEATGDGEIVTVVSRRADTYHDVVLAWSAFIAALALLALNVAPHFYLGLVDTVLGHWGHDWTVREVFGLALFVASIKFAGMALILQWGPLRRALTPRALVAARVRARAAAAFRLAAQGRTRASTGILIYLSIEERRAEILADAAIAAKVAPAVWGDAMHAMLAEIRAGRIAAGLAAAVDQVGLVLAEHLPRTDKPVNELPDGPIEL